MKKLWDGCINLNDSYWLMEAEKLAHRSNCTKMKVGAIIVSDCENILGQGWNIALKTHDCLREGVHSCTEVEKCYAVHAEWMALMNAPRDLTNENATIYVACIKPDGTIRKFDTFQCSVCARLIVYSGIKNVCFYGQEVPNVIRSQPNKILPRIQDSFDAMVNCYKDYLKCKK